MDGAAAIKRLRGGLQYRSLEGAIPPPAGPRQPDLGPTTRPTKTRDKAYEQAGRYVADRSDALIALWDGEEPRGQGGTEEIVAYAQENGVPIAWIHTKDNQEPTYAHSYDQDNRAKVLTKAAAQAAHL